jgi:hypothetical protein
VSIRAVAAYRSGGEHDPELARATVGDPELSRSELLARRRQQLAFVHRNRPPREVPDAGERAA